MEKNIFIWIFIIIAVIIFFCFFFVFFIVCCVYVSIFERTEMMNYWEKKKCRQATGQWPWTQLNLIIQLKNQLWIIFGWFKTSSYFNIRVWMKKDGMIKEKKNWAVNFYLSVLFVHLFFVSSLLKEVTIFLYIYLLYLPYFFYSKFSFASSSTCHHFEPTSLTPVSRSSIQTRFPRIFPFFPISSPAWKIPLIIEQPLSISVVVFQKNFAQPPER